MRPLPITARFLVAAFVPIGIALLVGFMLFGRRIEDDVRQGIGQTLRDSQKAQAALRRDADRQRHAAVAALAENPILKASLGLWAETTDRETARRTVQEQLSEIGDVLGADLMGILDSRGRSVATIARFAAHQKMEPWKLGEGVLSPRQIIDAQGFLFDTVVVPVNSGDENLGILFVGRRFEPAAFHPQAVLVRNGRVVAAAGIRNATDVQVGLARCKPNVEQCSLTLDGGAYLALRSDVDLDAGDTVWTLHSVEQAASKILGTAVSGLWAALFGLLIAVLAADVFGARAVAQPLIALVQRLKTSQASGVLAGDFPENSSTREVNDLARAFNLAARSVAESQHRLDEAYLQITQTMAQTLDARDPYTAGHSGRVSRYAVAVAEALHLPPADIETIRVGANFHDIGKIGIPDAVLQKPGMLTPAEFEIIKQHPTIGKRLLEGVAKFRDYLSIVELHHENHDGSGYPWGLAGENIPLDARIVHVVDAYDAMTSSRPYRGAMPQERAFRILRENAGTQFDPAIVEVFLGLPQSQIAPPPPSVGDELAALEKGINPSNEARGSEARKGESSHVSKDEVATSL